MRYKKPHEETNRFCRCRAHGREYGAAPERCRLAVVAVYDVRANAARALAKELRAEACNKLARVTELSDIIITVVTDDKAMESIFAGKKDNLLMGARGKVFINCATISPRCMSVSRNLRSARAPKRWKPAWRPVSHKPAKARST